MRYYLSNGEYYIAQLNTGKVFKTQDINIATRFDDFEEAVKFKKIAPGKTEGYFVYDSLTGGLYRKKGGRKIYPLKIRQMIYDNASGKCELCGRNIAYANMTLDHIVPLSQNGKDEVENLQCTCQTCNTIKGSILPEDFTKRISDIFMYQMKKRYGNYFTWKLARILLCGKI